MNYMSLDYCIVYAFVCATLVIGYLAGRGIKDIREYAIANKSFGTAALVLTYLATDFGGGTLLGDVGAVFSNGIIYIAADSGLFFAYMVRGLFIAPCMVHFDGCFTMGDVMERLYGVPGKLLSGVASVLYSAILVAIQLMVLETVCKSLLGIDPFWGIIVGGTIMTIYAAHGGIKAVTATDIFQFLVLIVGIPLIASIAVNQAGGIKEMFAQLPPEKLSIFQHEKFSYYSVLFIVWTFFQIGMIDPAIIQRLLMGRSARQLRSQFLTIAAFDPALRLSLMFIGLAGVVLYPNIASENIVPHIIKTLLPAGIKGLAIAGLLGALMSTADSYLHAVGLTVARDVVKPLFAESNETDDELLWARVATLLAGLGAIVLSLQGANVISLSFVALELTGPMFLLPFVSGVVGLKTDQRSFYVAVLCTIVAFVASKLFLSAEYQHFLSLICIAANGIGFFGTHLLQHGGLLMVDRNEERTLIWRPRSITVLRAIDSLIPTPRRIYKYSQESVRKYGAPYVLFGTFYCICFTVPYFMWSHESLQAQELMLFLRLLGGVMCGLLLIEEKWSPRLVPYISLFWHATLLYCLPFIGTVMFLLTQGSVEWLINIGTTLFFLIVLVDWATFLILTVLGVLLGLLFYTTMVGPISIQMDFSTQYLLIYQGLFATLIGLLFARRRQQQHDYTLEQNEGLNMTQKLIQQKLLETFQEKVKLVQTLEYAGTHGLLEMAKLTRELRQYLRINTPVTRVIAEQIEKLIMPMMMQLSGVADKALNYICMHTESVSIVEMMSRIQKQLSSEGRYKNIQVRLYTRYQSMECDPKHMQALLTNSITTLQRQHLGYPEITIQIEDTTLQYPLPSVGRSYARSIKGLHITVTTEPEVKKPESAYIVNMASPIQPEKPQSNWEIACFEIARIVKAHYGYMARATQDAFCYAVPLQLREVRPSDLDKPHMELGAMPVRADDQYPGAQEIEQRFLEAVEKHTSASVVETIKTIIELIKWYHGPAKRKSGEPFYLHPVSVAHIVLDYNTDEATIVAALLHDTVEDTAMLLHDVEKVFGLETAYIVDRVTHLESGEGTFYKVKLASHESMAMLTKSEDKRAICVKIADRLHNMRTIKAKPYEKQVRTAKETIQFYIPQAEHLGLHNAVKELKALCEDILNNNPKEESKAVTDIL